MFSSAAVYRDNPYDENAEFFQAAPYADVWRNDQDSVAKGALIGALAGLGAGFVMNQFEKLWAKAQDEVTSRQENEDLPKHRQAAQQQGHKQETPDATHKAADIVSQAVIDRKLTEQEQKIAGPVVHYGFAALAGALYGAFAEATDMTTVGFGTAYGALIFLGADEITLPSLKLSPPPNQVQPDKHLYALASHLVYGASLEGLRRALLKVTR
jgi:putative membrane protein